MRSVSELITQLRHDTGNEAYGDYSGISDNDIIDYLNRGQKMLQGAIMRSLSSYSGFDVSIEYSLTYGEPDIYLPGHPSYSSSQYRAPGLPWMGTSVRQVEFSRTGENRYYEPLDPIQNRQVSSELVWPPVAYVLGNRKITLSPTPSSTAGKLRVTYPALLPTLDKSRGTVSSSANNGGYYTTITLNVGADSALSNARYVCVVDWFGTIKLSNIPVVSYDSNTRVLTLLSSKVPTSEYTIAANDYVVIGQYASTFPQILEEAERYILAFAHYKIVNRDKSDDSIAKELTAVEADIISNIQEINQKDIETVPVMEEFWFE